VPTTAHVTRVARDRQRDKRNTGTDTESDDAQDLESRSFAEKILREVNSAKNTGIIMSEDLIVWSF
jgi:hypothetical protein